MKRLLDMEGIEDPSEQRLASLFAAVRPTRPDPFRKQRVRAHVGLQLNRHLIPGRPHILPWGIVGSVLIVGTAAAAIIGATTLRAAWHQRVSAAPTSKVVEAPKVNPPKSSLLTTSSSAAIESAEPEPVASAPTGTEKWAKATPSASGEDPSVVAAAIQALRNNHDPARARLLLNQYLRANPRGALAEEALALSIEAANALGDPTTGTLGCRYVKLYPKGRSVALASRVCEKSKP